MKPLARLAPIFRMKLIGRFRYSSLLIARAVPESVNGYIGRSEFKTGKEAVCIHILFSYAYTLITAT